MSNIKYANELRIANIVSFPIEKSGENTYNENSMIVKISQLYASAFILGSDPCKQYQTPIPKIMGIPLTEEWLLKFGFKYCDITNEWFKKSESEIEVCIFIHPSLKFCTGDDLILNSVHELQNYYYGKTFEELEYQPS